MYKEYVISRLKNHNDESVADFIVRSYARSFSCKPRGNIRKERCNDVDIATENHISNRVSRQQNRRGEFHHRQFVKGRRYAQYRKLEK